jgi:hypothetical protein
MKKLNSLYSFKSKAMCTKCKVVWEKLIYDNQLAGNLRKVFTLSYSQRKIY